ncbi:MAG: lytic murein transglycosylase B [Proteobacteria bacterium]|nr:lytic murein transglycosylase B [Pseudomonadota bacterium]MBS0463932.1 lytic murein transglycosylase B [Pseudomonadota bacterium]
MNPRPHVTVPARLRALAATLVCALAAAPAWAIDPPPPADLAAFAQATATTYHLDEQDILADLHKAHYRQSIVDAMSRPAESVKTWKQYRPIFVTARRIAAGRAFFAAHHKQLQKVEDATGVPAELICAIIGVETGYGGNTGSYRVLDALYTLAFWYPRSGDPAKIQRENDRQAFFRDQLAQLFALANEQHFTVTALTGSYAGAMGWGQFMPSSYRQYAVDGDGDGHIDLFGGSMPDLFASVANYFVANGWQKGEPVAVRAVHDPSTIAFAPDDFTPKYSLADLEAKGYQPKVALGKPMMGSLLTLDGANGTEDWIVFQNFYSITRYNRSPMYAMAVYQLAEAIAGKDPDTPPSP